MGSNENLERVVKGPTIFPASHSLHNFNFKHELPLADPEHFQD